jgi:beta-lactamase regulating signal transducer with metallopeptidase domain
MNAIINNCLTALNNIGRAFCDYSAGVFVQSALLIILLLLIDFMLRKRVRATFRYWMWILVFIKLILPPTLSLPTGIGYWCGDFLSSDSFNFRQASIIAQQESFEIPAIQDFPESSEVPAINESMDSGGIATSQNSFKFAEVPQIPPSKAMVETTVPTVPENPTLNPITWQAAVFLIWFVGVLVISVLLIQRMLFVRGLITQSEPSDERLKEMLNQCRRQLGIGRYIELRLSNNISSPAVCGLFKPILLMPAALDDKLSPEKLRAVFIHELAHIQRGDLWINLVQTILQIIYFYNPFVWLANAMVQSVREQAVDEKVLVVLGEEVRSYSNTLIDVAEMAFLRTSLSLRLIGVVESKRALNRRIKIMLNRPVPKSAKLGVLGLVVITVIGVILLPMAKAQKQSVGKSPAVMDLDTNGLENQLEEKIGTNLKSTDTDFEKSDETNNQASSKLIPTGQQYKSESTKVDIAIEDKDLRVIKLSDRIYQATIILRNKGSVPIPRFRVNFYAGDPDKGGRLLSLQQAGPIMPGDSWGEYNPGLNLKPDETVISVVVDPDNKVKESDETNNKASQSISMIVSESEDVHKVGAIKKMDLAGDDILLIEAQEETGFNFPYYLFIPSEIDKDRQVYMLVETNNSGTVSDDLEFHQTKALMLTKRSHANRMAKRLGVPLLVPTFPRPKTNWWIYTHALDIDTLEIEEGKLGRIDLQLTAMIKHAQGLLRVNGFTIDDRIFMHGFSASAKFCNRYSYLHPEMVKAVAAGGVNGLPTLPVRRWNDCELPFPIGIAGIERFIDGPFNEEAFRQVAHYIYMGSLDRNDTLPSRDAWREGEAGIIKRALVEKMMPDRWELSRKIYQQQKLPAQLVTYNGVTHAIKSEMLDDVVDFFKANSEEKYVRIEPYEYPFVESKEIRPKYQTESAKIDIAVEQKNFTVTEKPGGLFEATIRIYNKGSIPIPRFRVNFYAGDPDKGGRLLSPQAAGPIMPGDNWGEYNPRLKLRPGENTISVVVDPDNKVEESDETNNKVFAVVPGREPKESVETIYKQTSQTEVKITSKKEEKAVRKVSGIDITPADFNIRLDEKRGICVLVVSIQNKSSLTIPKFRLKFYRGDPSDNLNEAGNVQSGSHGAGPIEPGKKWNEGTRAFHLPDGRYDFVVFLDFDNNIYEIDENNNMALLQVKIENGRIADESITCPCSPKDLKTDVQVKSLTGSSEDIEKFSVTLSNGLMVELIGVCDHPSEGKQWWRPDGSTLHKAPYESRGSQPIENSNEEKNRLVEFAISFAGRKLPYTDVCYTVHGATRTSGGGDVQPTPEGTIKSIACEISKSRDTAEVRLGVAAGQWKTITEYDGGRGGFVGPDDVVFSDPIETKRGTAIAVRGEWGSEGARRIIAVDKNGNTHTGGWWGRSTGLKTLATTSFYNVKPEQIQKFQLQFRPYEWVEFKNVSLRPGLKTDVEF